jgi:inhibitor of cysteine peptidase
MPETLILTEANQGATSPVAVGQDVTIRLGENPTTGYRWTLEADPQDGIEVVGSEYAPAGVAPGAAGTREFHLRVKAAGSIHLYLKLVRSWESQGSAVDHHEFTLQVVP